MLPKIVKIIGLSLAVGLVGVLIYQNTLAKSGQAKSTAKVRRGDLAETLTISGTVDADEKAALRFQTSGYLAWVGVKEGDSVRKFQTLASLDAEELRKNLQKYLNTYSSKRRDFEQTKADNPSPPATDAIKRILEKAQFDLDNSVIDVEIKNLAVKYAALWTPIEGLVTHLESPYAGVNVTPAQSEIDIVNPKTVYFSALADQNEVTQISEGQTGDLTLDAYPDEPLSGSVRKISFLPKAGESGTVYEVKFYFSQDNSRYQYKIGMTGDLTFTTSRAQNVLYLPNKYLKTEKGRKYINLLRSGQLEKTFVETGLVTDTDTEIKSGLTDGETVSD